ncbi:MAG: electron transport complex subunit E [Clostridia bacterium]|nr:electron transport complex subunit E [Clostridia bacterium]
MAKNKKPTFLSVFLNGLIFENPTFALMLGMCPTLAITIAGSNGLGMGLATTAVLVCSNLLISILRHVIPDKVRIPAFIVVIASFVTMIDLLLKAYIPALSASLGMYIPLIVVNCIIFARAESFAFKNPPLLSIADGLGMGLGFTAAITLLSVIREVLGTGKFFGVMVMPASYQPMAIMTQVPGGFVTLGILLILVNAISSLAKKKAAEKEVQA